MDEVKCEIRRIEKNAAKGYTTAFERGMDVGTVNTLEFFAFISKNERVRLTDLIINARCL